ncbi:hypothetical protein Tco_0665778, partial [Tanacetum coccineum]
MGNATNSCRLETDHNQVGCRLPAVEHYKPHPYAQTLLGT